MNEVQTSAKVRRTVFPGYISPFHHVTPIYSLVAHDSRNQLYSSTVSIYDCNLATSTVSPVAWSCPTAIQSRLFHGRARDGHRLPDSEILIAHIHASCSRFSTLPNHSILALRKFSQTFPPTRLRVSFDFSSVAIFT